MTQKLSGTGREIRWRLRQWLSPRLQDLEKLGAADLGNLDDDEKQLLCGCIEYDIEGARFLQAGLREALEAWRIEAATQLETKMQKGIASLDRPEYWKSAERDPLLYWKYLVLAHEWGAPWPAELRRYLAGVGIDMFRQIAGSPKDPATAMYKALGFPSTARGRSYLRKWKIWESNHDLSRRVRRRMRTHGDSANAAIQHVARQESVSETTVYNAHKQTVCLYCYTGCVCKKPPAQ